jgi:hypothetical protein
MTFLLISCSDYHPKFTRENPVGCSQIFRGATSDLIVDDAFEPIPLSRIEGIPPTSRQLPDLQTTLSSAENLLSIYEPRAIEDMLDDLRSNIST